jgi:hypothetical protein
MRPFARPGALFRVPRKLTVPRNTVIMSSFSFSGIRGTPKLPCIYTFVLGSHTPLICSCYGQCYSHQNTNRKKYEIATDEVGNPIKQDEKKGQLREFKKGDIFFNYGCLPVSYILSSFVLACLSLTTCIAFVHAHLRNQLTSFLF